MDPLTAIALAGLAISAGGTLANVLPGKAEKERREKIAELTDLEKQGKLGLTDAQRAELQAIGMSPVQALQREQRARAGETIGLGEVGAGGVVVRQAVEQEGIRQAARDVGLALTAADREKAASQKEELQALKQRQDVQQQMRREAIGAGIEDVAVGATQIAASAIQAKQQGLLMGDEAALRRSINAALESGTAYALDEGGTQRFSPEFADLLRKRGYNNTNIAFLEATPRQAVREIFLQQGFPTQVPGVFGGLPQPGYPFAFPGGYPGGGFYGR